MNGTAQSTTAQYAVIQVSNTTHCRDRLVIAYPNEETLRDLIAGPSIVGLGFASREDAVANLQNGFPDTNIPKQVPVMMRLVDGYRKCQPGSLFVKKGLAESRTMTHGILQFAVAAAIFIVYSKNIVSATIRAVLGGSL